jgi:hypothetical protein
MCWIKNFEKTFCIKTLENSSPYLIIEGEQPYLQKLGDKSFAVKVNKEEIKCDIYNSFDTIAFLVNDWIKIQDSLEMIFNLLTGGSNKSLKMLSYLREHTISTFEFACYLYEKRKILLINRFAFPNKNKKRESNLSVIKKTISDLPGSNNVFMLIVGNRNFKSLKKIARLGKVIHPSGIVLNTKPNDYYETWYKFNNNRLIKDSDDFNLSMFHRL